MIAIRAAGVPAASALLLILAAALPAQTYDPDESLWPVEERGTLQIDVGEGALLTLPGVVERVALADPDVARLQVISEREVLVTGLKTGRTTIYAWLAGGERYKYALQVLSDLDLGFVYRALQDLDRRIVVEVSADGKTVVLRGEVDDRRAAREALARAETMLAGQVERVIDLLRYPGYAITDAELLEERLLEALREIDPRIEVQRIQVGPEPDPERDSYVLQGRVGTVRDVVRAVTIAERQLGGRGTELRATNDQRLRYQRFRGFTGGIGGVGGGSGVLQGSDPIPGGLSSQVSRGLVVTSESGRVISLLEVDDLPQVLVSIRVVEVDRTKAKKVGINWRFDNEHVSIGSILSPQIGTLAPAGPPVTTGAARTPRRSIVRPGPSSPAGAGTNLFGAYIDKVSSVVAAIDFLEDRALARSVAEPNILTLSGEPATVVVGGEVPIPTTTLNQVASVQGFFFQDFGVRLDIRPTVVEDGMIALEAAPSIIRRSASIGVGDVPGFSVQSVETTARVQTGESLVLGGLLSFEEGLETRKIPGLGWLPGLGRWSRKSRNETELLFIISPRIVETPRRVEPAEPVPMPDLDEVAPPELDWPPHRDDWRDEFEPQELRPDGVPPTFLPERFEPAEPVEPIEPAEPVEVDVDVEPEVEVEVEAEIEPELSWDETPEIEPAAPGPDLRTVDAEPCLNLRSRPGMWDLPRDCLVSGTRLEVLEEDEGWARVRLEDGRVGWVASAYLDPLHPETDSLTLLLHQLDARREALERQLETPGDARQDLEEQLRTIQQEIDRIRAEQARERDRRPR